MTTIHRPAVLIVEDEVLVRLVAVEAFLDAGFSVHEADHAAHALVVYAAVQPIEVLITDVCMPGEQNGIQLAERLRSTAPTLLIVITSALPLLRSVDHIGALFVPKPYVLDDLCSTVKRLLAA